MRVAGVFLLLLLIAHASQSLGTPEAVNDGWPTASLETGKLNPAKMAALAEFIREDSHGDFRSLLISSNGKLVFEAYFNGHRRKTIHDVRSVTKSFTSALTGIAIAKGYIEGAQAKVVPAFQAYAPYANDKPEKRSITVEHLLTMASGLDADVNDPATPGYEDRMWETQDWLRFALDLPMTGSPGTKWAYASVNTFLLGAFIEEAAGQTLEAFAREHLFGPLGIKNFNWRETPKGRTVAQGNLSLRARDMLKFGQLYLDKGRWQDKQILPEQWVNVSIKERYPVSWNGYDMYGYSWYTHTLNANGRDFQYFFASGNGGNKIYVIPDEGMVVAIQSAAYNTPYGQSRSLDVLKRVLAALAIE
ncbi:MAG: beta-lactamase family protein [Gammaproteobacteria bacterium]|nr:beta-lactamase family protein [Gammaproteobacteria bacterium]